MMLGWHTRKVKVDKIYRVVMTGYVIKKDYMDKPDSWDWGKIIQKGYFAAEPDIEFIEMQEERNGINQS